MIIEHVIMVIQPILIHRGLFALVLVGKADKKGR